MSSKQLSVHVDLDLSYSNSLGDFRGCFFNYQMNRYLSRGLDPDEYLKVFSESDMQQRRNYLHKRHLFVKPHQALVAYRDFCREAFLTETQIRDFFVMCGGHAKWIVENFDPQDIGYPFSAKIVQEILHDLANIVYARETGDKVQEVLRAAHEELQQDFTPGKAYIALEPLFIQVFEDWDVSQDYVGDDHGKRLQNIFCAQSMQNQPSANCALNRGFNAFYQGLPDNEKFPRFTLENSPFKGVNCYFLFCNNPLNTNSLESEFVHNSITVDKASRADFFHKFPNAKPYTQMPNVGGVVEEVRTSLVIALAAGHNFLQRDPYCDLLHSASPEEVKPFPDMNIGDWLHTMVVRSFANDLDYDGKTFREGQARPGVYISKMGLKDIFEDEEIISATSPEQHDEESYRQAILGMAPKTLQEQSVPGEEISAFQAEKIKRRQSRKRRRGDETEPVKVDTGEGGKKIKVAFETEAQEDIDPKVEQDTSTMFYAFIGVGTFLGLIFLNR